MKATVENTKGPSRIIKIEVSGEEINRISDSVYANIAKRASVPGFRAGKVPRDLLETHYGDAAREEVLKRAIPEYYLKALEQESLAPVAPPEIEDVQFKNHTLYFKARIDVRPQIKLRAYKKLKVIKKKIKIESNGCEQVLERLRQSKAKQAKDTQKKEVPELNDEFAKSVGFSTLQQLKEGINKDLEANARMRVKMDVEGQLLEGLLKRNPLDAPQSLVNNEAQELLKRLKMDCVLRGESKVDVQAKEEQLKERAGKEAAQRVRLSFLLDEIGQQENIQVTEEDLSGRITEISQRSGRTADEVRQYLDKENLIPSVKQELRNKKTVEFLLAQAQIHEEK